LNRVLTAAEAAGLAAGILAPDAETARRYADQGLRFIGIGSDATLLALAGKHAVDRVRRAGASG
jgi:2-keto-3-deoxy-L-rhamnonate aldolase RhmA